MYSEAKETYARYGIDTEKVLEQIRKVPVSINCWQGDDVIGFEKNAGSLSGGIQTTGNYPGRARNAQELMRDFEFALSFIPGAKRLNLHASYLVTDKVKDRNEIEAEDYRAWTEFAKKNRLGLDFNPTCFSHPMVVNNLTLSSPHENVRNFWVEHCRRSRLVAQFMAKETGSHCLCNLWIPDGFKDTPADRLTPRLRLKESLDRIYDSEFDGVIDSVESKVFGIGVESFTVGSSEFYLSYAAKHKGLSLLLDNGHYHPTEAVSEKISALLCYFDWLPFHVTRSVRWDSDHVVRLDDELREIAKELVRCDALDKALIGLDFFDASINRITAWIVGTRNMKKALLMAMLEDNATMQDDQEKEDYTHLFAYSEQMKNLPWQEVWKEFLRRENIADDFSWFDDVRKNEKEELLKRG